MVHLQAFESSNLTQGNSPLHCTISTAEPLQFFPPQDGAGVSQFLILFLMQEAEQFPTNHSDHPPLTKLKAVLQPYIMHYIHKKYYTFYLLCHGICKVI